MTSKGADNRIRWWKWLIGGWWKPIWQGQILNSLVQPSTAKHIPVQSSRSQYSPVQPSTTQNIPVQSTTAHHHPYRYSTTSHCPDSLLHYFWSTLVLCFSFIFVKIIIWSKVRNSASSMAIGGPWRLTEYGFQYRFHDVTKNLTGHRWTFRVPKYPKWIVRPLAIRVYDML